VGEVLSAEVVTENLGQALQTLGEFDVPETEEPLESGAQSYRIPFLRTSATSLFFREDLLAATGE
jgi:hypothetical protein